MLLDFLMLINEISNMEKKAPSDKFDIKISVFPSRLYFIFFTDSLLWKLGTNVEGSVLLLSSCKLMANKELQKF